MVYIIYTLSSKWKFGTGVERYTGVDKYATYLMNICLSIRQNILNDQWRLRESSP